MKDDDMTVIAEIETNNFDLLRLMSKGGVMDSKGELFTIRIVRTWEGKTKANRPMWGLSVQIVTKGKDNYVQRQDVIVKTKVVKETVVKEIPKQQELVFDDTVQQKKMDW